MKESGELVLSSRHYGTKYDYHYVPPSYGYGYQTYGYGYTPGVGYGYGYHPGFRYGYQPGHGYNTKETDKSVYEWDVSWTSKTQNKGSHVVLSLDITGCLSLVDQDHMVIKNFTQGEKHVGSTIYRATLDKEGVFHVYRDTIGSQPGKSVELWRAPGARHSHSQALAIILGTVFGSIFLVMIVLFLFCRYGRRN